ncbi:MAG TPA: cysteine synthase, partial [Isosphaeraceae bacterium]
MHENVLQAVGHTPLVRLRRLAEGVRATVCVKVEALNPGGSVKDRLGVAMVEEAERCGRLRPGGTIIEATAGNTGVGLALAAAVKGYRCIFVLPDKMSGEKVRLLRAYGAEIVITPSAVAPDAPESYNGVADRLAREIPGAWRPNQFANPANPEVHYRATGPEIWEQTRGRITAFVAGVGTGGTISGVGRYLKERNPAVRVVGADPEGSVLSGDAPRPWKVEGIGEDFVPQTLNGQVVDEWIRVGDAEAFHTARALARREGLLLGGSSGTAVAAALRYARRLADDDVVVALAADTGRNYLSKFHDDAWLAENRLHWDAPPPAQTLGDLLRRRGPRPLVTVGPETTAAQAVELMQTTGISQLPVLREGVSVGSIQEVTPARVLHDRGDPG